MCRFLVYRGREICMSDLLIRSEQSLIRQSYKAREREEPLNGDGFGVGWYVQDIDPTPGVFTSVTPAWSNRNLHRLADKIHSSCVFAHVRAASPGAVVTELNCHPFQYRNFLWMHNGRIPEFQRVRRKIREHLSDEFYNLIEGTTDSEHAFALFMHRLRKHLENYDLEALARNMAGTIRKLERWSRAAHIGQPSFFNFAVTDGRYVVASRYVSGDGAEPETLCVAKGERFESREGLYDMISESGAVNAVIIASEPLTDDRRDWQLIPRNQLVPVSPDLKVEFMPID
jgi:ergothioneine biosynthesis protein EgtC